MAGELLAVIGFRVQNLRDEDLAFLLSPRHFAAAIATGKVGDVEMWEVAGGLSLLGYFEWLAVLVRDTEHRPDLRDGIIGHARWSHSAGVGEPLADSL